MDDSRSPRRPPEQPSSPELAVLLLLLLCGQCTTVQGIQCERITLAACQGLGYNMTAMPNLAGHASQAEAEVAVGPTMPQTAAV